MELKKILLATATVALFGVSAAKADGAYVSGQIGYRMQTDPSYTVNIDPDALGMKLKPKAAPGFQIELGYQVEYVRVAIAVDYARHSVNSLKLETYNGVNVDDASVAVVADVLGATANGDTLTFADGFAKAGQLGVMANAYFDIAAGKVVKPYIGLGVGAVSTRIKSELSDEHDGGTRFAWQVMVGSAFQVSEKVALTLEASHRGIARMSDLFHDAGYNENVGVMKVNTVAAGVRVGF